MLKVYKKVEREAWVYTEVGFLDLEAKGHGATCQMISNFSLKRKARFSAVKKQEGKENRKFEKQRKINFFKSSCLRSRLLQQCLEGENV